MMFKRHWPIIIIAAVAASLIFANLANQYLWQDEAETAVIGRNCLKYGFPRAYDGKNFVNPRLTLYHDMGYGPNEAWIYHPPVQFYVAALSFKLFGESTFPARLPFALVGVANVILVYILGLRLTRERFVASCAAFLVTVSVPFLLMMRQCRYYSLSVFLVLLILIFYSGFLDRRSRSSLVFLGASAILLAYTVHGMFVPVMLAVAVHYFVFAFDVRTLRPFLLMLLAVLASVAPWFMISKSTSHAADITFGGIEDNLEFQVRMINKYIFPAAFFGIMYLVRVVYRKKLSVNLTESEKKALILLAAVVVSSVAVFCFAEQRNFRYLLYFMPIFALIEGMILSRLVRFSRFLFVSFLFVSVSTGIFNDGKPNLFFPKYLYEITHDYDGPIEGIVKFLKQNAKKGDTVKIIFGDLPIMFYTDLVVDNFWMYSLRRPPTADWIVFRRGWHELLENDYYTKMVGDNYIRHVIGYPDIKWENRPDDMGYHRFWTDKDTPGVVIFEKKKYCETRSGWYW